MKIIETQLKDAYILEPQVFGDNRGWFMESFNLRTLTEGGLPKIEFVQDNHSYSLSKGVIRGLHCQVEPHCQTKLVRCTRGEIDDVIVDVRQGSPTFKKWIKVTLSESNKRQLFVPKGFLHGFVTLTEGVEVEYKVDNYYDKSSDRSIRFDDPEFSIDWGVKVPVLSEKDRLANLFKNSNLNFIYTALKI